MRADYSTGKGMPGMDKIGSVIDRMNMKLGSKFSLFFHKMAISRSAESYTSQ